MKNSDTTPSLSSLQELRRLFPAAFRAGELDLNMLTTLLSRSQEPAAERYGLNWVGKQEALDQFHEPPTTALRALDGEFPWPPAGSNIFMQGDNLEALKHLQQEYCGKVKAIYIDPPYNTGKDFIYADNFREHLASYLRSTGQARPYGGNVSPSTDTDGRIHSRWLSMMYPRLALAKNLLSRDGVIFVSIDDHELPNLRLLLNEIFGAENFLINLVWENREGGGSSDSKSFKRKHEYILVYAKDATEVSINGLPIENAASYKLSDEYEARRGKHKLQALAQASIQYSPSLDYPIIAPDGSEIWPGTSHKRACYRWSREKVEWGLKNGFIVIKKDTRGNWKVWSKQYLKVDNEDKPITRTRRPGGVISKYSTTQASKYLEELFGRRVFDYAKPVELIEYLLRLVLTPAGSELVLDFFAGSGTTGEAVWRHNLATDSRHSFLLVQLAEPATGSGYATIADIAKERLRLSSARLQEQGDIGTPGFQVWELVQPQSGE